MHPVDADMRYLLIAILTGAFLTLHAAEAYTVKPIGTTPAPYGFLEHLPADFKASPKRLRPLIIFLHGLGELGASDAKDLPKVAGAGPLHLIASGSPLAKVFETQSAIILAPQGLKEDGWWKTEKLTAFLDYALATYPIDPDRVYVTGLSMGGGGTWVLGANAADKVAAIVPICGAAKPEHVDALHTMPIWAFHASDDPTVNFTEHTVAWFDALLADRNVKLAGGTLGGRPAGGKGTAATASLIHDAWTWLPEKIPPASIPQFQLTLTIYADGGHGIWTRAYNDPNLWTWLFAQHRPKAAAAKADAKPAKKK